MTTRQSTRLFGLPLKGKKPPIRAVTLPALLLLALGAGGCVEYTIETTLNPDGSGVRAETLAVEENDEFSLSREAFSNLMYAGPEHGWTEREAAAGSGDTLGVLNRTTQVRDLASWSRLNNQVRMAGALPIDTESTVGLVTLGDIELRNSIRVGTGSMSDGSTSYTFRETFAWEKAVDALGEYVISNFDQVLGIKYPALSPRERGEIIGLARARYWVAVDGGLLTDDGPEDQLTAEAVEKTAEQAIKIVRLRYPQEGPEFLTDALTQAYEDDDSGFETFLKETVPGLNLAINTEIIIRLNMPGRVINSNAHERDGTTLVWKFGALDAMATPVEIFAESVVGR